MNNTDPKQRFLLMMALCLTFYLALTYIMPMPSSPPPAPAAKPAAEHETAPGGQTAAPTTPAATGEAGAKPEVGEFNPQHDYTVAVRVGKEGRNEHGYEARFSSVGGSLARYQLLGHYRKPGNYTPENQVILLDSVKQGRDSMRIDQITTGPSRQEARTFGLRSARFELEEYPAGAVVEPAPGPEAREGQNLVFRHVMSDWEIRKIYTFPKEGDPDYTLRMTLEFRNISTGFRTLSYRLSGATGLLPDDETANFGAINILTARQPAAAAPGVEIERKPIHDLVRAANMAEQDNRANLAWLGARNRFFAALMTVDKADITDSNGARRELFAADPPLLPPEKDILDSLKKQPQVTTEAGAVPALEDVLLAVMPPVAVESGAAHRASYLLYAGPAVDSLMEGADARLHGVVSYTISYFDFISRWLVQLLTFLDRFLGNYGLAIIAVTIIIKLLLHPLNRKSFVSMNKMQVLGPKMKELQQKYANDKVKQQQEMSKFYKENGVSMAGGCLPVFLQLPIFFALYGAFSQGFSMRHAAFIPGWINDLSKPDSVHDFGWVIPLLNSPYLSILPILYLGLQLLQMHFQPKSTDPQQAQQQRIMKIMPVMFVFIFYSMPAGLVLYFTVSALAGVAENWWMRTYLLPKLGIGPKPAAAQAAAAQTKAGAGAAVVPSDARKKKKK